MDTAYVKRIGFYIILAVLALGLIASLVYHAFAEMSNDLELMFLKNAAEADFIQMKAYMSLEESVVAPNKNYDGYYLEYPLGENAEVSVGDTVVRVYSSADAERLISRAREIDEKIAFCKKSAEYASRYSVAKLTELMDKSESDFLKASSLTEKNAYRREFEILLAARASKTGEAKDYENLIKELEKEKESVYGSLGNADATYKAAIKGDYFSGCDGYESLVSSKMIAEGSLEELCDIVDTDGKKADAVSLGKLVNMNNWNLVCKTTKEATYRIKNAKQFSVRLGSSGKIYKMSVERVVSERTSDDAIIIFSSDRMISKDDYEHFQNVDIIFGENSGYKIPITAVKYENGVCGVYVLRGSLVKFRQIEIIASGDGYVIASEKGLNPVEGITALNRYDRVIVRGQNLYDGKVITRD